MNIIPAALAELAETKKLLKALGATPTVLYSHKDAPSVKSYLVEITNRSQLEKVTKKGHKSLYKGNDRSLLEQGPSVITELEGHAPKDKIHQRNSGLNHVLCAIMKEKKITYGFSFTSVLHAKPADRAKIMGRMSQNKKLCTKFKVPTVALTLCTDPYDMRDERMLKRFLDTL